MKNEQLGKELKFILSQENDIVKISRWAFKLFSDNCRDIDSSLREVFECLFSMEDDPQFEFTIEELNILSEMLINNETDPLKKIRDIKKRLSEQSEEI